ncbi:MAG: phosphatase PAP2 family protein [Bdellovibrio sp.]|nr:phosphatase PAP2 family protein [Bdellovibrio sp.]
MKKFIILSLMVMVGMKCWANESSPSIESSLWGAMKETGRYMYVGAGLQFTQQANLYWAGVATPSLWYSFQEDKRVSNHYMRGDVAWHLSTIGNFGIVMNMPFFHMGVWYTGKYLEDEKFIQFSKEYAATVYIALLESGVLSYVQIHHRPNEENLSNWETDFRGNSSFPSGHVVPYASLFFKTLQFYGPLWSTVPLVFTVMSAVHRVQDGKHYLSDVVGGFFLAGFASEGVRAASKFQDHHPFYKWWAQHDLKVSLMHYEKKGHEAMGPWVSLTY